MSHPVSQAPPEPKNGHGANPTTQQTAEHAYLHTQRRIRLLAGIVIALWVAASATIVSAYYAFFVFVVPRMQELLIDPYSPDPRGAWQTIFQILSAISIPLVICAGITCALAATGTILLVLYARRSTLRHVGANLAALSAEIRALQQELAKRAGP